MPYVTLADILYTNILCCVMNPVRCIFLKPGYLTFPTGAGHPLSPRGFVRLGPLRPHGGHDVAMSSLGGERCNGRSAVSGLQSTIMVVE